MILLLTTTPAPAGDAAFGQLAQVIQRRLDLRHAHRAVLVAVLQSAGSGFFDRHFPDGQVALEGFLDQRSPLGVADDRVERRHHDGILGQPAGGFFPVGIQALHGPQREGPHRADGHLHGLEQTMRNDRHHHVQFQLPGLGGQHDGGITAHHMEHAHVQHFGHDRVDLARHDARAGLDRRQPHLVQPGGRAGGQQAEIVGDADQGQRQRAQGGREIGRIRHGLHRFEQVIGLIQLQPG